MVIYNDSDRNFTGVSTEVIEKWGGEATWDPGAGVNKVLTCLYLRARGRYLMRCLQLLKRSR